MNTKINLTYNNETFTLEYNRMSIKLLEQSGFKLEEFLEKPMSNIELAFSGAFLKNHQKTNQSVIDEIYRKTKNKKGLITCLQNMITECYDSLLSEPEENDDEGNATWEIVDLSPKKSQK